MSAQTAMDSDANSSYAPSIDDEVYQALPDGEFDLSSSALGSSRRSVRLDRWRRRTRSDRNVYRSLQQLEHNDLPAHLYNVAVLKRRTCDPRYMKRKDLKTQTRAKKKLRHEDDWAPRHKWTAWPLELHNVPLESERWGKDEYLEPIEVSQAVGGRGEKPSDELTDVFTAECIRQARISRTYLHHCAHDQDEDTPRQHLARSSPSAEAASDASAETEVTTESEKAKVRSKSRHKRSSSVEYTATPAIDDIEAQRVLRPFAASSLSQLDRLLCALDRSRENNAVKKGSNRNRAAHKAALERRDLLPRDWSEVLGVALQVGWDTNVVHATRKRCEKLFSEKMEMQHLLEIDNFSPVNESDKHRASQDETVVRSIEQEVPETSIFNIDRYGYRCPEAACAAIFETRDNWLGHIENVHRYRFTGAEVLIRLDKSSADDEWYCPEPDCQRHTWPYDKRWRLQEHMKRNHGMSLDRRPSTARSSKAGSSPAFSDAEDEMYGGVHFDGFLQPIKPQKGWRASSRSTSTSHLRGST